MLGGVLLVVVVLALSVAVIIGAFPVVADGGDLDSVQRSPALDVVSPNGTVDVTVEVVLEEEASTIELEETFDPGVEDITIVDNDGATDVSMAENKTQLHASFVDRDHVEFTYRIHATDNVSIQYALVGDVTVDETLYDLGTDTIDIIDGAIYQLTDLELPDTVTHVQPFDVNAMVENVGSMSESTTIELRVDNAATDTIDVELSPGESVPITFSDIRIDTPGEYRISIHSTHDSVERPLTIIEATASVTLEDQRIGESIDGTEAIYLNDVTADAGWTIALTYSDSFGQRFIVGMLDIEEDIEDDLRTIEINDLDGTPGNHGVHVIPVADDLAIGDRLPDDIEVLATDSGIVYDASIMVDDQSYEDETDTVTIDAAGVTGGPTDVTAYVIGLYLEEGSTERLVGASEVLWNDVNDVDIELDEALTLEGEHSFTARLHFTHVGVMSDPIRYLQGEDIVSVETPLTVTIEDTPNFHIQSVNGQSTVAAGDTLTVDVTVTNTGAATGTKSIWMSYGEKVDVSSLHLQPEETGIATLSIVTDEQDIGDHTVIIDSGAQQELFGLSITEPQSPETPTESDPIPGFGTGLAFVAVVLAALVMARRMR